MSVREEAAREAAFLAAFFAALCAQSLVCLLFALSVRPPHHGFSCVSSLVVVPSQTPQNNHVEFLNRPWLVTTNSPNHGVL